MSFIDFHSELLSHEILMENQSHQVVAREGPSFAFYSRTTSHPNPKQQPCRFSPNPQGFKQQYTSQSSKPHYPPMGLVPRYARPTSYGYRNGTPSDLGTTVAHLPAPQGTSLAVPRFYFHAHPAKSMVKLTIEHLTTTTAWITPIKVGSLPLNCQPWWLKQMQIMILKSG